MVLENNNERESAYAMLDRIMVAFAENYLSEAGQIEDDNDDITELVVPESAKQEAIQRVLAIPGMVPRICGIVGFLVDGAKEESVGLGFTENLSEEEQAGVREVVAELGAEAEDNNDGPWRECLCGCGERTNRDLSFVDDAHREQAQDQMDRALAGDSDAEIPGPVARAVGECLRVPGLEYDSRGLWLFLLGERSRRKS